MEKQHSGLGIASFVISLCSGVLTFILLGVAGFLEASNPGGLDETSLAAMLMGLLFIALLVLSLLGVILGIIGLAQQPTRKKLFALLGTILGLLVLLGSLLLLMIGLLINT